MMNMLYELKKLFSAKLVWGLLALNLLYMLFIPFQGLRHNYRDHIQSVKTQQKLYTQMQAAYPQPQAMQDALEQELLRIQQQDWTTDAPGIYGETLRQDFFAVNGVYEHVRYLVTQVPHNRSKIIKEMLYDMSQADQSGEQDWFTERSNALAIKQYNRILPLKLVSTGIHEGTQYILFNYTMWEYLMLAFLVLMTVRMFTMDLISGAYQMIHTSKHAEKSLFFRKFGALALVALLILLFHLGVELIANCTILGLSGFHLPLQQLETFEMCPYFITIGGFYVLKTAMKYLAYLWVIGLTAWIASVLRKPLTAGGLGLFLSCGGLVVHMVFYLRQTNVTARKIYRVLRMLLPQGLLNAREYLQTFDVANVLQYPVGRLQLCCGITICSGILFIMLAYGRWCRIERRGYA